MGRHLQGKFMKVNSCFFCQEMSQFSAISVSPSVMTIVVSSHHALLISITTWNELFVLSLVAYPDVLTCSVLSL